MAADRAIRWLTRYCGNPAVTDDRLSDSQRRGFFREAAARVIGPLASYLDERISFSSVGHRLRPPGAIEEASLATVCYRCGSCVSACPADAIFPLDQTAGEAAGTPAIDPDRAACVVCDGLECTKVCPSGALTPVRDPREIRMGLAEVYASNCLRDRDDDCSLCVDRCPMGNEAIRFESDGPPIVLPSGCVGCGVCQLVCPTSPKAIVVVPAGARATPQGTS